MFRSVSLGITGTTSSPPRVLSLSHISNFNLSSGDTIAEVSLNSPSQSATSSNNLLAYRPSFSDTHSSNLGTILLNMRGIFPCLGPGSDTAICGPFTRDDDGFNEGRSLVHTMDAGNDISVFGNTLTYAIAVEGCPQLNTDCLPSWYSFTVTCQLPRQSCG